MGKKLKKIKEIGGMVVPSHLKIACQGSSLYEGDL
jgi:hypothetical protein